MRGRMWWSDEERIQGGGSVACWCWQPGAYTRQQGSSGHGAQTGEGVGGPATPSPTPTAAAPTRPPDAGTGCRRDIGQYQRRMHLLLF